MKKITPAQFAEVVRETRKYYPAEVIAEHGHGVLNGKYNDIAPSTGSNTYRIRKDGNKVIATTTPIGEKEKRFELIA